MTYIEEISLGLDEFKKVTIELAQIRKKESEISKKRDLNIQLSMSYVFFAVLIYGGYLKEYDWGKVIFIGILVAPMMIPIHWIYRYLRQLLIKKYNIEDHFETQQSHIENKYKIIQRKYFTLLDLHVKRIVEEIKNRNPTIATNKLNDYIHCEYFTLTETFFFTDDVYNMHKDIVRNFDYQKSKYEFHKLRVEYGSAFYPNHCSVEFPPYSLVNKT